MISTFEEPLRGWINNLYGPLGLLLAYGLGILHLHDGDMNDETTDMVHVDMVVNSLICATREVALNHETEKNMQVHLSFSCHSCCSRSSIGNLTLMI